MYSLGIVGHTGNAGTSLSKIINPHLAVNLVYTESGREPPTGKISEADLIVLCIDDKVNGEVIPRIKASIREDVVLVHMGTELRTTWPYGLPEINRKLIAESNRIASPGCYPTGAILTGHPIKDVISDVVIIAYSGVSGAPNIQVDPEGGITPYEHGEGVNEGRKHKHLPELDKNLGQEVVFKPHRVETLHRGIMGMLYATISCSEEEVRERFKQAYQKEPFVHIVGGRWIPDMNEKVEPHQVEQMVKDDQHTNNCHLSYEIQGDRIKIRFTLDNLVKGAAGQVVQIINIKAGYKESMCLRNL